MFILKRRLQRCQKDNMEMESQVLEGFSNETLFVLITAVFISIFITYMWNRVGNLDIRVHPAQRATVIEAREHRAAVERDAANNHTDEGLARRRPPDDGRFEQCPICLDQMTLGTETNCGHVFCAPCIVAYWEAGSWLRGMNCPICRQEVSLLLPPVHSDQDQTSEVARQSLSRVHAYNRRFSGEPRTLFQYLQDFPVLFRHLVLEMFSVDGLVIMFRLRILLYLSLAALYILSPLDLIPEAVTGVLGFVDDIIVLLVVLVYVTVLYRFYVAGG